MHFELTNLLPPGSMRALRRVYFLRVVTVAILFAVLLIIVHGLLLLPSYLFALAQVKSEQEDLNVITQALETSEEREVEARITVLRDDITYLGRLGTTPRASDATRAVLQVPKNGIRLTGLTFTAPTASGSGKMSVTGIAPTRDSLRLYTLALEALSFVETADLPISAYAKERDIPFTIMLAGSLTP